MRIKTLDNDSSIDDLATLAVRPDVPDDVRPWIEQELRNMRRGRHGERDAEYDIEFHFGSRGDVATIHGLRLEFRGRVAQIDHLILTRFLDIWVCESKAYRGRVEINDHGEWQVTYAHKTVGIDSPVLQTWRHIDVLAEMFMKRKILPPLVLGQSMLPKLNPVVLFSNDSRIQRPVEPAPHVIADLKAVMKVERLSVVLEQTLQERMSSESSREISPQELADLARKIAELHRPRKTDWEAKFGLASREPVPLRQTELVPRRRAPSHGAVDAKTIRCASCGIRLRSGEVDYCTDQSDTFQGRLLCWRCQRVALRATS